jgi:DNA replication protein DnaC
MVTSLKQVFQNLHRRTPLPERFFCSDCGNLTDVEDAETVAWVAENRPDLLDASGQIAWLFNCRALQAERTDAERKRDFWADANLPQRDDSLGPRTMVNFQRVAGTESMVESVETFLDNGKPPILTLTGQTGCGKSHMVEHIIRATLDKGRSARYETAASLLDRLRHTFNSNEDGDLSDMLAWYRRFSVLVIDDLGAQPEREWGQGYMTRVVDERYADGGQLVVTSNKHQRTDIVAGWGDRLYSRLFDTNTGAAKQVFIKAGDYRRRGA